MGVDFLQSSTLEGRVFPLLAPMMERIIQLTVKDCDLGMQGCLRLAGALGECEKSSLEEIILDRIGALMGHAGGIILN